MAMNPMMGSPGTPTMSASPAAQPSFWDQMMAKQKAQAMGGAQQQVGGGVPGAGGLTAGGFSPSGMGAPPTPGTNMDGQQGGANPAQLQQLQARAAAMSAGGAMPQGGAPMQAPQGPQGPPKLQGLQKFGGGMQSMGGQLGQGGQGMQGMRLAGMR